MGNLNRHENEYEKLVENLPSSIPRYQYRGKEQCDQILNAELDRYLSSSSTDETSEFVLFDIDPNTLQQEFLQPDTSPIPLSWFDTTRGLLLTRLGTHAHTEASRALHDQLRDQLRPMGLQNSIARYSGVTIKASGSGKEGDCGWGPKRPPPGSGHKHHKPTVAVEVAVSETLAKIRADIDWWLDPQRGDAKFVITMRVNRKQPMVTIETWERGVREHPRLSRRQQIVVSRRSDGQITYSSESPLIVPFEFLFHRPPAENSDETDVHIGKEELAEIADAIWNAQDFIS